MSLRDFLKKSWLLWCGGGTNTSGKLWEVEYTASDRVWTERYTLWKVSYQQSWHSKLFWSCWLDTGYLWGWEVSGIKLQSGHSDVISKNRRQVCPGIQIPFPVLLLGKIPYTNYLPGTPGPDWKLSSVSEGAKCFGVWGNGCGKWYSAWWAAKRAFLRDAQWQQKYRRPNPEKNFFGMCETKSLADEGFPHSFPLINYEGFLLWGFSGFITGNPKTMWQHNGTLKSQVRSLIGWDVMFWERVSNETNISVMK